MTVSVCDVSIKGRKPDHEFDVWSMSDIDISNFCLGNLCHMSPRTNFGFIDYGRPCEERRHLCFLTRDSKHDSQFIPRGASPVHSG